VALADAPPQPEGGEVQSTEPAPVRVPWRNVSIALVSLGVVVVVGAIRLARPLDQPFTSPGDLSFIELGIRHALHHTETLGVYSRFGWHHPGPAFLYAFAPLYWLSGDSSRSLFLGTWLINGVSAFGAVWLVRRRAGELGAGLTAAAVFVLLWRQGFVPWINPWNPRVLAVPILLLMVSAASAAAGHAWSFVIALGTTSYLVQAHVGTAPICAALLLLALVGYVLRVRSVAKGARVRDVLRADRAQVAASVGIVVLAWALPALQQLRHGRDGNLAQIAKFYLNPPHNAGATSHPLGSSIRIVSNHASALVFGAFAGNRSDTARFAALALFFALGLGAALIAARQREWFIAALALTTPLGITVAVLAATRVIGPLDNYLFYWTNTLALPAAIAAAWLIVDAVRRHLDMRVLRALAALGTVVLVILGALSLRMILRAGTAAAGDVPAARAAARHIENTLGNRTQPFTLQTLGLDIERGAVFVQLDKDGYHFAVDPSVDLYRGNTSPRPGTPTFLIRQTNWPPPVAPPRRHIATAGDIDVSVER